MVQILKIAAVLVLTSVCAGAQVLAPVNGGTGEAGTITGVLYGNGAGAVTQGTAAQIVSGIGSTAVANATNATTVNSNTFPASAGFTSGGIPFFSSTSAVGSSGLLTHYGVLYGGGSAAAPVATAASTTTTNALFATATAPAFRNLAYTDLPSLSANTLLGSLTATTPSGQALPSCSTSSSALIWTSGTGFSCNTSIIAASATGAAGSVTNALTMNNGGAGAVSGTTFNGSAAQTISYNTLGAAPLASPVFTGLVGIGSSDVKSMLAVEGTSSVAGTQAYGFFIAYTAVAANNVIVGGGLAQPTTAASTAVSYVIPFGASFTLGAGGSVGHYQAFYDGKAQSHTATNNATLTDNLAFTGNYFINQSGTDPSQFGGAQTVAGAVTHSGESSFAGYSACYTTGGLMGHCTSIVGATGTCTCVSP
jgi:hypothetical protein